ncbi:Manganese transport system membrane protein MntB [Roseimaritima multifibrata]|uniref:Manganese transport system membrane protein MntB n=1 Tax=Roseimaritima multifibrata TaxID=1930274 RepID=A0A517MIU3_9BACT|nr:metal ABC transporter permease [Roseimaritima multifibrata]QDS94768.1 Manganese transport system membrane protein MntB [Roseimaritima multifibrata]
MSQIVEILSAPNTRVVLLGVAALGFAAGIVGTYLVLRRRALAGDVVGHAALPGVSIAFLIWSGLYPTAPKNLLVLLIGGAIASALGMLTTAILRRFGRLPDDAVLAIVLSTFFGAGVVLLSVVQRAATGSQAGIREFIFGQAAAMLPSDVHLIIITATLATLLSTLIMKEWTLVCFDEGACQVLGYPVLAIDIVMMGLVVCVCIVGMQAVGLLLVVALLVIPPSAARFWTDRVPYMAPLAGVIGSLSAVCGGVMSALFDKLPTGAVIVIAAASILAFSMVFGTRHGWLGSRRAYAPQSQ